MNIVNFLFDTERGLLRYPSSLGIEIVFDCHGRNSAVSSWSRLQSLHRDPEAYPREETISTARVGMRGYLTAS